MIEERNHNKLTNLFDAYDVGMISEEHFGSAVAKLAIESIDKVQPKLAYDRLPQDYPFLHKHQNSIEGP